MNTNTIETIVSQVVYYTNTLKSLPMVIIIGLACIVVGYFLKLWPRFDNRFIPHVIIGLGTVLSAVTAGKVPPDVTLSNWYILNALLGMIISFVAWGLHYVVLSRFEDKLPWLGKMLNRQDKQP